MRATSAIGQALPLGGETLLSGLSGGASPQDAFAAILDAVANAGAGVPGAPGEGAGKAPAEAPGSQDAPGGQPAGDPKPANPAADQKRPPGDNRSAQDIIDGDPTLKNLGNQSGVKDSLKKQVGDFEHDPDAAYRASQVLQHIKQAKASDGTERSGKVTDDGKIEGFTKDGDARHGTEAGLLQDFGKYGYSALKDDQTLDKTNDKHVKKDGTNMDNTTFAGHEIVHGLSQAAGWIGKELDKLPGPLKSLAAPLHLASKAVSGGLDVADAALTGGDVKQAGKDMAHGLLSTGSNIAQGIGELAGDTVGKIPGIGKLISAGIQDGASVWSNGLHVADTAVQGGNVRQAAEQMGANVAGTVVSSTLGMADPTGMVAGAAGNAVTAGIDQADGAGTGGTPGGQPRTGGGLG